MAQGREEIARPTSVSERLLAGTALCSVSRGLPAAVFAATLLVHAGASANPQGGTVSAGTAQIVQNGSKTLEINQQSQRAVIDWKSFNIEADEATRFNQPNAGSVTLNRVNSPDPSRIYGSLSANGQIVVINSAGVLFGPTSHVDVGGITASTANITNENFMAGRMVFDQPGGPKATIVNQGTITVREGGLAAFVAPGVQNSGVIEAKLGKVELASGQTFTLDLYGDGLVKLAVDDKTAGQLVGPDGKPLAARVDNTGRIAADGGAVYLTVNAAKGVVDNLINAGGVVEARSAEMQNGKIVLRGGGGRVQVTGTLDATGRESGAAGGTVKVLGEEVEIQSTALIDASGRAGGGTVLVGGDYQGKGPDANAARTTVAAGATIHADAVEAGDGGTVVVWSDGTTAVGGRISARGGRKGGSGGKVETSGKERLVVAGSTSVDTRAPKGKTGTWLLDPKNVRIGTGAADADDVTIDAATINGAASNVVVQADNDITLDAGSPISIANEGVDLTMRAGRSITLNDNVSTASGNITLTANDPMADDTHRDPAPPAAGITLAAGKTISAGGTGAISIGIGTGAGPGAAESGDIDLANLVTAGGGVSIANDAPGGGAIRVGSITTNGAAAVTVDAAGGAGGAVTISNASGTISLNGDISTAGGAGNGNGAGGAGGDIAINGAAVLGSSITLTSAGGVGAAGTAAGGAIRFAGTIDGSGAGGQSLTLTAGTGDVTLSGAAGQTQLLGALTVTSANDVSLGAVRGASVAITSSGTVGLDGAIGTTGDVTVDNGGALTVAAGIGADGGFAQSGAGPVNLAGGIATAGAGISFASAITLTGDVTLNSGGGAITLAAIDGGKALTADSGSGTVNFNGALGAGAALGSFDLTAGTGTVFDQTIHTTGATRITAGAGGGLSVGTASPGTLAVDEAALAKIGSGSLTLRTTGAGAITVGDVSAAATANVGDVTLASTGTGTIDVLTPSSFAGGLTAANGGQLTVRAGAALSAASVTQSGAGAVSLAGDVTAASGALRFASGVTLAGSITLAAGGDIALTSVAGNGNDVTLDAGPAGAMSVSGAATGLGTLTLANGASFTFDGPLAATKLTTAAQGYAVALNGGASIADSVTFANSGGVALGNGAGGDDTLVFLGGLTSTAGVTTLGGTVRTDGQAIRLGATTLAGASVLDATNAGGAAEGASVTLASVAGGGNNLALNGGTGGAVSVTGAAAGIVALGAAGATIALNDAGNDFGTVTLAGGSASVADAGALVLGTSNLAGSLTLSVTGAVTQSGAISVDSLAGSAGSLALNQAGNAVGTVSGFTTGRGFALLDGSGGLTIAGAVQGGAGPVSIATSGGALGVDADVTALNNRIDLIGDGVALAAGRTVNGGSGTLTVNARAGAFRTGLGTLALGTGAIDATADAFALDAGSQIGGTASGVGAAATVSLAQFSAGEALDLTGENTALDTIRAADVSIGNGSSGALTIGPYAPAAAFATNSLSLTSGGAVTIAGALDLGARTLHLAGASIAQSTGAAITAGLLTAGASAGAVSLGEANRIETLGTSAAGTDFMLVDGTGGLRIAGAVTAGGAATIRTTGGTLSLAAGGSVAGADVGLTATDDAISLAGDVRATGDLALTATDAAKGGIVQSGGTITAGTATADSGARAVTLGGAGNDFGTFAAIGGTVTVRDAGAIDLGATKAASLAVTAGGDVTQSGVLTVSGTTQVTAVGHDVAWGALGNDVGTFRTAARNVALKDTGAVEFGASTITGTLDVTAGGAVTQAGALRVTGATTVRAGANDVMLADAGNDFATFGATGGTVSVADANAIELSAISATNLTVAAGGAVTQGGVLTVGGTATFDAAGQAVTLTDLANQFGTFAATGAAVSVADAGALALGTIHADSLVATAGGPITQSGAATVGGASSFTTTAGNASIALDDAGNALAGAVTLAANGTGDATLVDTRPVTLALATYGGNLAVDAAGAISYGGTLHVAGDVALTDTAGGLTLGPIDAGGRLAVTAPGAIGQSGAFTIGGTSAFTTTAGNGAATLDLGNAFAGTVSFHTNGTGGATLVNTLATTLGASTIGGGLLVRSDNGAVTQDGALRVGGATAIDAAGRTVTLDDLGNDFATFGATGTAVRVTDAGALDLGATTATSLVVDAGGAVTQSGRLVVTGLTSVNAVGQTIALADPDNDFGTFGATGANVAVRDANAIDLATTTATGTLQVTAGGAVTQSGAVVADTLTGSGASLRIETSGNRIATLGSFATESGFSLVDGAGGLTVSGPVSAASGDVALTTPGALAVNGAVTASAGSVALASSGGAISLGADVTASVAGGTVTLTATDPVAGAITQAGGRVAAANLGIAAGQSVSLTSAGNDVATLAASVGGFGQTFAYADANGFEIGTVGALRGVATDNADASLAAALGDLTLSQSLDVGAQGHAHLAAAGGAVRQTGGALHASALVVEFAANSFLDRPGNDVATFAAAAVPGAVGKSMSYTDANGFDVGTVAVTTRQGAATRTVSQSGVSAPGGDLALVASGGDLTVSQPISVGAGTASLTAAGSVSAPAPVSGGTVRLAAGNAISAQVAAGTLSGSAGRDASVAGTVGTLGAFATGSGLSLVDGAGGLVVAGAVTGGAGAVTGGAGAVSLATAGGDLAVTGSVTGHLVRLTARGGSIALAGDVTSSDELLLTADGDIAQSAGTVAATANLSTLTARGGDINLSSGFFGRDIDVIAANFTARNFNLAKGNLYLFENLANGNVTNGLVDGSAFPNFQFAFPESARFLFNGVPLNPASLAAAGNQIISGSAQAVQVAKQVEELAAKGDTNQTPAQQAFTQRPERPNYGADPFQQKYNVLGVADDAAGRGIFDNLSYVQDGFWEGLLKQR